MAFAGTGKIWMNGKLVEWKDAKIHIASHVIHYGSGVFEGARCYETPKGSACFRLDAHMRRLLQLREDLPDGLRRSTRAALDATPSSRRSARTSCKACYIRPLIYRGYDTLGVNPLPCPVDAAIMRLGMGRLSRRRSARAGRRREGQLVDAHGAEHVPGAWPRAAPTTRTPR